MTEPSENKQRDARDVPDSWLRGKCNLQAGPEPVQLTLPATSANLGPGFDALGLALSITLEIQASLAPHFSIEAHGRDTHLTGSLDNNLILTTYAEVLTAAGRPPTPLALRLENEIPLGMGCGSSAAALCAGVLLANHFGSLGWSHEEILQEAAQREGHPDNVAACLRGGLTASKTIAAAEHMGTPSQTVALTVGAGLPWRLLLALPRARLATTVARQLLPEHYSRKDAVENVQSAALLVAAFALDRPDLLRTATGDRLHQPYRMEVCPLFAALLPVAAQPGVFSVTLSGAGPSVLLIVDESMSAQTLHVAGGDLLDEVLEVSIAASGATIRPYALAGGKVR